MSLFRISSAPLGAPVLSPRPHDARRVIALGYFDGVHVGHGSLIDSAVSLAEARGLESAVFTFSDEGMKPGEPRLMSVDDRLGALGSSGVFAVFCADFSAIRSLSPEEFVRDVLVGACGAEVAVCGFNFRFGAGGAADADELCRLMKKYGGEAVVFAPISVGGVTVSSTAIRAALSDGRAEEAREMLGKPYSLHARIEHGARIGRTIDFPTINQYFPENAVIPRYGVYAVECQLRGALLLALICAFLRLCAADGQFECPNNRHKEGHLPGNNHILLPRRL